MGNFFFGKNWSQSWTAWGLVVFGGFTTVMTGACGADLVTVEMCETINAGLEKAGAVMVALGIRRAQNAPSA